VIGLWLWAATYAPDGDLLRFDGWDLAEGCDYTGDKDLMTVLIAVGLIDEDRKIHDWSKHGLKMLQSSQARQRRFRERVDQATVSPAETEVPAAPDDDAPPATLPSRDHNVTVASYHTLTIPNQTSTSSPDAAAADVDNSEGKVQGPSVTQADEKRLTAVAAAPENDLEQIIYDRVGWDKHKRMSRMDIDRLLKIKRAHPPDAFYAALDKLHGGVTNVPRFLEAVLAKQVQEQKSRDMKMCRKCGHEWNPWTSGNSLCPVCYPGDSVSPAPGIAQIMPLVEGLGSKMGMTG